VVSATAAPVRLNGSRHPSVSFRNIIGCVLAIAAPMIIWFSPISLNPTSKHALAVASFMIVSWITETMPHAVTGMIGCYLFWALKIVPFELAFGGFADETPWFVFGAALFGVMVTKSGLACRLAYMVMRRVGAGYSRLLLGLIISSFLLTLIVPSGMACIVIMASVALGVMDVFHVGKGSSVGRGIFVTLTCTAGMFDKMVISGAATIFGRGLIRKETGIELYWSQWLMAFLPIVVVTVLVIWKLAIWLYPPEPQAHIGSMECLNEEFRKLGPWSSLEKKSFILMSGAIALWSTDFLHHISPAVVGIGAGLLAAVPRIGIINQEDLKRLNYLPVLFTATAISMGSVLGQTKALQTMTSVMFDWMRPLISGHTYSLVLVTYWTAFVYHIFLGNEISMLSTSMPALLNFAKTANLPVLPIGMVWAFAGGGKIFAYQSAVMVTGYSYGYFDGRDLFKMGIILAVLESVLLLIFVPVYWPLLGIR
jgi:sodium-dependent dicarboxylate transporter 2/3/5